MLYSLGVSMRVEFDKLMEDPEVFAGYKRTQAVADELPRLITRAYATGAEDMAQTMTDALSGGMATPVRMAFLRRVRLESKPPLCFASGGV